METKIKNLVVEIIKTGMSIEALADKMKVTSGCVQNWHKGNYKRENWLVQKELNNILSNI